MESISISKTFLLPFRYLTNNGGVFLDPDLGGFGAEGDGIGMPTGEFEDELDETDIALEGFFGDDVHDLGEFGVEVGAGNLVDVVLKGRVPLPTGEGLGLDIEVEGEFLLGLGVTKGFGGGEPLGEEVFVFGHGFVEDWRLMIEDLRTTDFTDGFWGVGMVDD